MAMGSLWNLSISPSISRNSQCTVCEGLAATSTGLASCVTFLHLPQGHSMKRRGFATPALAKVFNSVVDDYLLIFTAQIRHLGIAEGCWCSLCALDGTRGAEFGAALWEGCALGGERWTESCQPTQGWWQRGQPSYQLVKVHWIYMAIPTCSRWCEAELVAPGCGDENISLKR